MTDDQRRVLLTARDGTVDSITTARLSIVLELTQRGWLDIMGNITDAGREALERCGRRWVSEIDDTPRHG